MSGHSWHRTFLFFLGLVAWSGLFCPLHAAGLGISPSTVSLAVEGGQTYGGSFTVSATSTEVTAVISVADWLVDQSGKSLYPTRPLERSLCKWIEVAPARFVVKQGKPQTVRYRVMVPDGVSGDYWGMIQIQAVAGPIPTQDNIGLVFRPGIGLKVFARAARGAVIDGRLTEIKADLTREGLQTGVTFINMGNTIAQLNGRFEIKDKDGALAARIPFVRKDMTVFPGSSRVITGSWPEPLKPGNYVLLAIVDYGGKNVIAAPRSFKVPG